MPIPATSDPQLEALKGSGPQFITEETVAENGNRLDFYREHGYLVIPDALGSNELYELRTETLAICLGERGDVEGFDPHLAGEGDESVLRRYLCIHFPHKISEVMTKYLATPKMVDVLTEIIGPDVKCMQSMLFIKATGKPGQAWHQDEDFIPTRDRSLTGGWIAMDDATIENGCLWVIPGSHKHGVLWPLERQDDARFDCTDESTGFPYRDEDAIPVEVKAGSIVFFNGYLLHRSFPNRAQSGYRRVLVNHYMSAASLLPWRLPKEGEYMAIADYRDIVMVAGKDPYAWKGTEHIADPLVRPTGEGGCENWGSRKRKDGGTDD
jgi:ectoine hydroxylase-related dioxygenase (phytanoyl-CoA dioxygenase family)